MKKNKFLFMMSLIMRAQRNETYPSTAQTVWWSVGCWSGEGNAKEKAYLKLIYEGKFIASIAAIYIYSIRNGREFVDSKDHTLRYH